LRALLADEDSSVRRAAAKTVATACLAGWREAFAEIQDLLVYADMDIRIGAIQAIAEGRFTHGRELLPHLRQLLSAETESKVQIATFQAIAAVGPTAEDAIPDPRTVLGRNDAVGEVVARLQAAGLRFVDGNVTDVFALSALTKRKAQKVILRHIKR